jgi:hypothetical protein
LPDSEPGFLKNFFGTEKLLSGNLKLTGTAYLTINTGIAAYLWRDIIDSQAAPQPSGRHRTESNHLFLFLMLFLFDQLVMI